MVCTGDCYDKIRLEDSLKEIGYNFTYLESTKSTMDFFPKKNGKVPLLILADHQTHGKGRYSNVWNDEKRKSVLMTIVETNFIINNASVGLISHLVALTVCLALKEIVTFQEIKIKWPNDIMLDGKKIAGILIEQKGENILIGIGINAYKDSFENAFLINKENKFGRQSIVISIIKRWSELKKEIESGQSKNKLNYYAELWKNNSFILNKRVAMSLKDCVVIGTVKEIFLGGDVLVDLGDGISKLISENDYVPGSCVVVK